MDKFDFTHLNCEFPLQENKLSHFPHNIVKYRYTFKNVWAISRRGESVIRPSRNHEHFQAASTDGQRKTLSEIVPERVLLCYGKWLVIFICID